MTIDIPKVHGSGNDFFIIDETLLPANLSIKAIDSLRQQLCDRQTGLLGGADGLLLIEEPKDKQNLAKMRVINSDGSEASMCGNGLRTVARYLSEKSKKSSFFVETMYANLAVKRAENLAESVETFQVEISPVYFDPNRIPMKSDAKKVIQQIIPELSTKLLFSVVAVPNPHLITFVDHQTLFSKEFERIAIKVNEKNELFPDGINVSFVEVLGKNEIFVRTFERGVGFTNACGTAMCASSLIHVLVNKGMFDQKILVRNPGGFVQTIVHQKKEGYSMDLIGNATVTNYIRTSIDDLRSGKLKYYDLIETTEQKCYEML